MPAKNTVKYYQANSYYHIYNSGIGTSPLFTDSIDYEAFLNYLTTSLTPVDVAGQYQVLNDTKANATAKASAAQNLRLKNFAGRITLLAYILMPNEFHLLIHQEGEKDLAKWMQSFMTRFTMQTNKRHHRQGALFKGVYRAEKVTEPLKLLYLTRFFHRLPLTLWHEGDSRNWGEVIRSQPSSYLNYLGEKSDPWLSPEEVLAIFKQGLTPATPAGYLEFIEYNRTDLDAEQSKLL